MKKIEGFLIGATLAMEDEKAGKGEKMLFGNVEGESKSLSIFGLGGFKVFKTEEEVRGAISNFFKRNGYKKIAPVRVKMKILKKGERIKHKEGEGFVVIYYALAHDFKIIGPFCGVSSEAFEGKAGHFIGNGWKTFSSFAEAKNLLEDLERYDAKVSLASFKIFNLEGKELTRPSRAKIAKKF